MIQESEVVPQLALGAFLSAKQAISVGDSGDAAGQQDGDASKGKKPMLGSRSV